MPEFSGTVDVLANRLRLLQVELADASDEERELCLSQAIDAELKKQLPADRKAFLRDLETRFPTWDIRGDSGAEAAPPEGLERPVELDNWTFLLEELIRAAETLSEDDRRTLSDRLDEAGLVPRTETEWPRAAEKELREKLRVGEKESLEAERVLQLAGMLAEFARALDSIWGAWKKIAPASRFRKPGDLGKAMVKFVTGTQDMTRGHVKPELDALRRLVAGITNSVALVSHKIAEKYLNELSPDSVKNAARPKKTLECPPAPWWEKYEELAWGPTSDVIATTVRNLVADDAERIIQGLG